MNYEKKRQRQRGRQKNKPSARYSEKLRKHFDKVSAEIQAAIARGELPPVNFDPSTLVVHMANMTKEEFKKMYPQLEADVE